MMLGFVPLPNLQICDRAEGIETTITAIASDPGNDLLTYSWNFGDNTDIADPIRFQAQGDRRNHWQTYTYNVLASELELTALEFRAVGKEDKKGGFIDVVSVQEIIL